MEEKFNSINNISKLREMLILHTGELFKNRADYTFIGNDIKDNKVFIFDEEGSEEGSADAYPRIVLHRNGSRYSNLSGFNDTHESHEFFGTHYTRIDLMNHHFTFRVKATNFGICENLSYLLSFFLRFYAKEIVLLGGSRTAYELRHEGMSQVIKADEGTAQKSIFQCDVTFSVQDNEIANIVEEYSRKKFTGFSVEVKLPSIVCPDNCCAVKP